MNKILKYWNGRGHGIYSKSHINVAAYSQQQAAELVGKACRVNISIGEISIYYSPCWGNSMNDITPEGPAVYVEAKTSRTPVKRVI